MAPNASDPKDLRLVLNPARRKALTMLLGAIVSRMRSQTETVFSSNPESELVPVFGDRNIPREVSRSPSSDPDAEARQQRLEARMERSLSGSKMEELKVHALQYFDRWSSEVRSQVRNICDGPEDPRSEQRRRAWNAARNPPPPPYTRTPSDPKDVEAEARADAKEVEEAKDLSALQSLYPPLETRLTTISREDRICVISCMVLLLLSLGHYSAHSRVLLCYLTSSFEIPLSILTQEEISIAQTLLLASKALSADTETKKRQAENASARRWKVGLASVAGAAVIGLTGGLAAPVVAGAIGGIMGGVGLGGVASFLGIFAMNGALVGTLFGAFGGKMTGEMVDAYAKEVEDFKFIPIVASSTGDFATLEEAEADARRLRVTIGINGWLDSPEDVTKPWRVLGPDSEVFALRFEMAALITLGESLKSMVSSYAWSFVKLEILKRTVLATLWSALWPVYLLKMATSIDNPFAMARNRSEKAGRVLADALINKAQGERPVTLIGYSLGARVIYSCLTSLAERKAFGLVEGVILIGAPVPSTASNWRVMRSVVSGRVINVFSENDYILAFLYRATSIQFGVAGLQKIKDVEGVSNVDLSKEVSGHLRYPELIGKILIKCGMQGVKVEDENIEADTGDVGEVSLLDFKDDPKTGVALNSKGLDNHTLDLAGLESSNSIATSSFPVRSNSHTHDIEELAGGVANISTDTNNLPEAHNSQSPPPYTSTQAPARAQQSNNPPALNIAHRQNTADSDSDGDAGGIQMLDNESDPDGELQELHCIPEPDEDEEPPHHTSASSSSSNPRLNAPAHPISVSGSRDSNQDLLLTEPKSLGSFPKRDSHDAAQGESQGQSQGQQGRVRAADMGLY